MKRPKCYTCYDTGEAELGEYPWGGYATVPCPECFPLDYMACMGPPQPTERELDEAMTKVMELLERDFGVKDPVIYQNAMIMDPDTGKLLPQTGSFLEMDRLQENWHDKRAEFREALKALLWAQACVDF